MGVFFTFGMFTETIGFGVDEAGVNSFATSAAPLSDLSRSYVGDWLGEFILLGASFSAFACAIGLGAAASRILMSLGRDGFLSPKLGQVHPKTGAPANASSAILVVSFIALVGLRLGGASAVNAFFYPATIGVFLILSAYAVTNLAGVKFFFFGRRLALWKALIPVVGLAALAYTFYKNVIPIPAHPYNLFPYIAAAWLLVGAAIVLLVPGLAERLGRRLTEEDDS
jgi:amino acid transporter